MTSARRILELALAIVIAGCSSQDAPATVGAATDSTAATGGDAGAGDAADAAGPIEDCGALAWTDDACAACTAARCCSIQAICAAIPQCGPLAQCWLACGRDAGCTTACGEQYIQAISNYNAVLNCQDYECPSECGP